MSLNTYCFNPHCCKVNSLICSLPNPPHHTRNTSLILVINHHPVSDWKCTVWSIVTGPTSLTLQRVRCFLFEACHHFVLMLLVCCRELFRWAFTLAGNNFYTAATLTVWWEFVQSHKQCTALSTEKELFTLEKSICISISMKLPLLSTKQVYIIHEKSLMNVANIKS